MIRTPMFWAGDRQALVYTPAQLGAATPVLCFLHGAGEAAREQRGSPIVNDVCAVLAYGSPPFHCELNRPPFNQFVVICPQLEYQREWNQADAGEVQALVQQVIELHQGWNPQSKVVTGFSFGGAGVLVFANSPGTPWTALWLVAPRNRNEPIQAAQIPAVGPIYLQYGQPDRTSRPPPRPLFVGNGATRIYRDDLLSNVTQTPRGHTQTCIAAYLDPEAHVWLHRVAP
jgi:dienelactone hydrolase